MVYPACAVSWGNEGLTKAGKTSALKTNKQTNKFIE